MGAEEGRVAVKKSIGENFFGCTNYHQCKNSQWGGRGIFCTNLLWVCKFSLGVRGGKTNGAIFINLPWGPGQGGLKNCAIFIGCAKSHQCENLHCGRGGLGGLVLAQRAPGDAIPLQGPPLILVF